MSTDTVSSERFVAELIDHGNVSGQQFLVVGLCMFFNMLDGFDITAMAVVAGAVGAELNLTDDKIGWIFSFTLAGMMAGAMTLAPLSDLMGRRRLIIASLVLVGVSIVLTAQADTLPEFIVLRFISGLGAGAMLASQAALAAEYSPTRYRALSVALVTSGYPLGAMFTSVVAGFLMPDYGWRGMFVAGGGLTVAMAFVAFLLIPESLKYLIERRPENALENANRILNKMSRPALAELPAPKERSTTQSSRSFTRTLLLLLAPEHRSITLRLWVTFFLSFATLYFLMSWIPKLMVDEGFDEAVGRYAFFLFNLGGVLGIYLLGGLSTRFKLSNLIFGMLLASAFGMIVFALAPGERSLLLTLIFAIGVLQQGGFTGLYGAAAKAYPTEIRSTGIGWAIGLGRSGAVVGPAVAGYLIVFGFDLSANFLFFAVPLAISAVLAYRLHIH